MSGDWGKLLFKRACGTICIENVDPAIYTRLSTERITENGPRKISNMQRVMKIRGFHVHLLTNLDEVISRIRGIKGQEWIVTKESRAAVSGRPVYQRAK